MRNYWIKPVAAIMLVVTACNAASKTEIKTDTSPVTATSPTAAIDGSWELVWENVGGKVRDNGKSSQFKMFHNGFFSLISQDSLGNWAWAGAGTCSLDGNTYQESFTHSTVPEYVGASDWQEYELKGDTLISRGFKKVIFANGEDKTNSFPPFEEKRVRARR